NFHVTGVQTCALPILGSKKDEIILGEKNRFIKRINRPFDEKDDVTYGIVFRNELKEKMQIDKVAFYINKVVYKTAYKIAFYEVKDRKSVVKGKIVEKG